MKPTVSVIIPCYNHAHYLSDALNSILAQTFVDWEAFVIDDGSTDNTAAVAAKFADPRIRYIHQENQGLSAARNNGIAAARGELIALLDADDVWEPTFLRKMVTALRDDTAASAVYCGFRYMDACGELLKQSIMKVVLPDQFRDELLQQGNWLNPCSVVVRASAYREIGPFDETLHACEDLDMWLRLSEHHRFVGVLEVLVRYRRSGTNMSDDVQRMSGAFYRFAEKHFGPLTESIENWTPEKRAIIERLHGLKVLGHLAQGDVAGSAENLIWLLDHSRESVLSLDLWYTLACVHQPIGQRGDFEIWDPAKGEVDLQAILDRLGQLAVEDKLLRRMRSLGHLALAWLRYGKRDMAEARHHLYQSWYSFPGLMTHGRWHALVLRLLPGIAAIKELIHSLQSEDGDAAC